MEYLLAALSFMFSGFFQFFGCIILICIVFEGIIQIVLAFKGIDTVVEEDEEYDM